MSMNGVFNFIRVIFSKFLTRANTMRIRYAILFIITLIVGILFLFLITRYLDLKADNNNIMSKNYTNAVSDLQIRNDSPILFYDKWRNDFNIGVTEFESGDLQSAIDIFSSIKSELKDSGDIYNACMADMDIAYIYEFKANKVMKNTNNADNLRTAAKDFLDGFMLRNDINSYCRDTFLSDPNNDAMNNSLIDEDQLQYNLLIQEAFKIDGKSVENEIDKIVDNFKKENDNSTENKDDGFSDPRLNELYKDLQSSQSDADKARDLLKNRNEGKVVRPW